eukprot:Lankesteria_metandrocarpae@DN4836_c0_g1_i2.p1
MGQLEMYSKLAAVFCSADGCPLIRCPFEYLESCIDWYSLDTLDEFMFQQSAKLPNRAWNMVVALSLSKPLKKEVIKTELVDKILAFPRFRSVVKREFSAFGCVHHRCEVLDRKQLDSELFIEECMGTWVDGTEATQYMQSISGTEFPGNLPPWRIISLQLEDKAGAVHQVVIGKFHHGLADGFALSKLFAHICGNTSMIPHRSALVPENNDGPIHSLSGTAVDDPLPIQQIISPQEAAEAVAANAEVEHLHSPPHFIKAAVQYVCACLPFCSTVLMMVVNYLWWVMMLLLPWARLFLPLTAILLPFPWSILLSFSIRYMTSRLSRSTTQKTDNNQATHAQHLRMQAIQDSIVNSKVMPTTKSRTANAVLQ